MHIELIDFLRCTHKHEDSHLVAVFHRVDNREVIDATLGCPVCGASFPLRNGVAAFAPADEQPRRLRADVDADPDAAVRLAAFLGLTLPGLLIVMTQTQENNFVDLVAIAQPRIFALTRHDDVIDPTAAAWLRIADVIPVASHSIDGIVLNRDFAQPATISEAHRLLKPGRRLVAPPDTILSEGFREIARDDTYVVAERMPELIKLGR
jgi:uncharacterized protein YbaR (Trm112 family)